MLALLQLRPLLFLMRQYSYILGDSPFSRNKQTYAYACLFSKMLLWCGDGADGAVVVVIMVVLA